MSIELGVWKVTDENAPQKVNAAGIDIEKRLKHILDKDISIIRPDWLVIGQEVKTAHGKYIDLLAIDSSGNLVVIELKKDRTYRDIVAQVLDYGAWVRELESEDIGKIFENYKEKYAPQLNGKSLNGLFTDKFKQQLPDELNISHSLVIVASSLDPQTERIVTYLSEDFGLEINALFFNFFESNGELFLARAWLMDNSENQQIAKTTVSSKGPWNGEYYACFMDDDHRRWDDAVTYGFISAGYGTWYTKTLQMLSKGDRVWVNAVGHGYVGVGIVEEDAMPVDDFNIIDAQGNSQHIQQVVKSTQSMPTVENNGDDAEWLVRIKWLKTVPLKDAIKEVGFFGNQNTVARPKADKWEYTVDILKKRFGIESFLS